MEIQSLADIPPQYINNQAVGESDDEFVNRIGRVVGATERTEGTHLPIYYDPNDAASSYMFPCHDAARDAIDTMCADAVAHMSSAEDVLWVYRQWCRLLPLIGLVPDSYDPSHAELVWSKVRCVIAGAGYGMHAELCDALSAIYHDCPFDPLESNSEWESAVQKARSFCGWPTVLGWLDAKDVARATPNEEDAIPEQWMMALALFHVVKYIRIDRFEAQAHVFYMGVEAFIACDRVSHVKDSGQYNSLKRVMGMPIGTSKYKNPITVAFDAVLGRVSIEKLPPLFSPSTLPASFLYGPWTRRVLDPTMRVGFMRHGLRVDGMWNAEGGNVVTAGGDFMSITRCRWPSPVDVVNVIKQRDRYKNALPSQYATGFPSDVFFQAFPNLNTKHHKNMDAVCALFDAPIFASLIRELEPALDHEYPFIVFQPTTATEADATNQGKSLAAQVYARAITPNIVQARVRSSSSSVESRAIAMDIETVGTLCLDEWRVLHNDNNPVSVNNLLTLCTGGSIIQGLAYQNKAFHIRLKNSIVASTKVIEALDDLASRMFSWYLDPLDPTQRARADVLNKIQSGEYSTRMRLGALAIIESVPFVDMLRQLSYSSSTHGVRYGVHRAIATLLYGMRTGKFNSNAIDEAFVEMSKKSEHNLEQAEDSGLLGSMRNGSPVRLRIKNLLEDIPVNALHAYASAAEQAYGDHNGQYSTGDLFKTWRDLKGMTSRDNPSIVDILSGRRQSMTDRAIIYALGRDLRTSIPEQRDWVFPGIAGLQGWRLRRYKDKHRQVRIQIIQETIEVDNPFDT